jgi:hypothetical protein
MAEYDVTLSGIAAQLARYSREMHDMARKLAEADRDAVDKREAFTMAYALAYIKAEGTILVRKHKATMETHTERYAAEVADSEVRRRQAEVRSLEKSIDVGRSIGSLVKSEIEMDKVR